MKFSKKGLLGIILIIVGCILFGFPYAQVFGVICEPQECYVDYDYECIAGENETVVTHVITYYNVTATVYPSGYHWITNPNTTITVYPEYHHTQYYTEYETCTQYITHFAGAYCPGSRCIPKYGSLALLFFPCIFLGGSLLAYFTEDES